MVCLGKNIRYLRKSRNLSQDDMAEMFGYKNYTTIQKWESDESDPPLRIVNSIAEYFNVDLDDLVKRDLENPTKRDVNDMKISSEATRIAKAYDIADEAIKISVSKLLDVKRDVGTKVLGA